MPTAQVEVDLPGFTELVNKPQRVRTGGTTQQPET